ncbi:MAG TPA: hypothetical protein VGW30_05100 [Gaiellaceae bacterium]|nr:hypothetical protein [Gaiellaceae bacterium]
MQLPSGLFAYELARGSAEPEGRSLRYTLMTEIGLRRASAAGLEHPFDLDRIRAASLQELSSPELRPGDFGLHLWADSLVGGERAAELEPRLADALDQSGLGQREGMEVAWIVQGLALSGRRGALLEEALETLLGANAAASGLLHHFGPGNRRRRFPNFATQIYGVLALTTAARLGLDDRALPAARRLADKLIELQLPDGGWPWLFDADRGTVVERYEVYSVHQHGMAPMALLELAGVSGQERYVQAASRGVDWLHGRNDLGIEFADERERLIYRSIRRCRPWDRVAIAANLAGSTVAGRPLLGGPHRLELHAVGRPYELGWLFEAWAGRESLYAA